MSAKRFDGSNFVDLSVCKKFDGANFVNCSTIKRYTGANWIELLRQYVFSRGSSNGLVDVAISESSVTKISSNRIEAYAKKSNITGRMYFCCPELTFYSYLENIKLRVKCKGVNNTNGSGVFLIVGSANAATKQVYKSSSYIISNTEESVIECSIGGADVNSNLLFPFVALTMPSAINSATIQIELTSIDIGWYRYYPTF